jgi:hypothetical protein
MLYLCSAWDSRLRSRMMRTTTTSCTMLLSIVYEKAQLQYFKTVATYGKFEAPIYKTSERKGVLSTSHLVQSVFALTWSHEIETSWDIPRQESCWILTFKPRLRRSLLQLHHVPRDSPLLQWCPQKFGCMHTTRTSTSNCLLYIYYWFLPTWAGSCVYACEYTVNTLWILNLSLVGWLS